jgi:hypothetical protein
MQAVPAFSGRLQWGFKWHREAGFILARPGTSLAERAIRAFSRSKAYLAFVGLVLTQSAHRIGYRLSARARSNPRGRITIRVSFGLFKGHRLAANGALGISAVMRDTKFSNSALEASVRKRT